jgi:hypothetical protein
MKLIHSFADHLEIWETQYSGTLKVCPGSAGIVLPLPLPLLLPLP